MSVIVQCPNCTHASTFHRMPVTLCPRCQQAYPDGVRSSAERALAISLTPKPALLYLGLFMSACMAVTFLGLLALAPFDIGNFTVNREQVSGPEFLRRGGFTFLIVGILFAAIAVGLWRDRPWVRPLIMAFWVTLVVVIVALSWGMPDARAQVGSTLASVVPVALIAWWYLYRKANVVAYFRARARPPIISHGAA